MEWYRTHGRLRAGDAVTMGHDAVDAYACDVNAGKDALLVCDTNEMCDALNRRIHGAKVHADVGSPRPVPKGPEQRRIR